MFFRRDGRAIFEFQIQNLQTAQSRLFSEWLTKHRPFRKLLNLPLQSKPISLFLKRKFYNSHKASSSKNRIERRRRKRTRRSLFRKSIQPFVETSTAIYILNTRNENRIRHSFKFSFQTFHPNASLFVPFRFYRFDPTLLHTSLRFVESNRGLQNALRSTSLPFSSFPILNDVA